MAEQLHIDPSFTVVIRSKINIHKPNPKLSLSRINLSQTKNQLMLLLLFEILSGDLLCYELDALLCNGTWDLIHPHPSRNLISCKWVFRIKHKYDGFIDCFKAHLVAKGFHQRPEIDFHDTFSPIVKPTTIRVILSLVMKYDWSLQQLDVNNAFLHGSLDEEVFMDQPPGFIDSNFISYVCKLKRAIYSL